MNLIHRLTAALLLVFPSLIFAQPVIEWQKSLGGTDWDEAQCIQPTPDGGYIVAGMAASGDGDVSGHFDGQDFWIVKLSSSGNIEWEKSYGSVGVQWAYSIQLTRDGGYIIAGGSNELQRSNDVLILKISSTGDLQWQKIFGSYGDESARSIIQTTDGGYVFAGYSSGKFNGGDVEEGHGSYDGWIVKLDNSGNPLWQKVLGGSSDDGFTSIKQTNDGGFIAVGYSSSTNGDLTSNHGGSDCWIVKLTKTGNLEWQKCLGSRFADGASDVEITTDGGFIVAGFAATNTGNVTGNNGWTDQWIVKMNGTGAIQWEQNFGGGFDDFAADLQLTPDDGYVVVGWSGSTDGDLTAHHGTIYFDDYWVTKLDNSGNLQWQKSMGGTGEDKATSITLASDGGYVVAGHNGSNDGEITDNRGGRDFWIVKLVEASCVPKVGIKASAITICSGNPVTFTANISYGGTNPSFQWMKNGVNVGTSSAIYTDHNLVNGDIITCILTSNAACATTTIATSNAITINVNTGPPVSTNFAGNGIIGFSGDGGPALSARLFFPGGICFDAAGNLYFGDRGNRRVRKIDKTTGDITTIAGTGITGYSGDGGPAILADMADPTGLFMNAGGDLYIAETLNNAIRKIAAKTGIITTVAGSRVPGFSGDGGLAVNARLDMPTSICMDAAGDLYIADTENQRIRKVDAITGIISTIAGNGSMEASGDGGLAINAAIFPYTIKFDGKEFLYVADGYNHLIRRINLKSGIITTIAGNGTPGYSGDGGSAATAQLKNPTDLCFDSTGNLYINDRGNNRIRKIDMRSGIISTVAGTGLQGPTGDESWAINARLDNPWGVAIDGAGDLYIADANNDLIRRITGLTLDIASDTPLINAGNNSICKGTATVLAIDAGNLNGAAGWIWYKDSCGGLPEGNGISITVNPITTTTYYARGEGNCVSPGPCGSITIIVNQPVTPSLEITATPSGAVCPGTLVTFTASPVNAGSAPVYQWSKNGVIVGTNAETYTTNALNNNDVITCKLTSNAACLTQTDAVSNIITIMMNSLPIGAVSPASSTICNGSYQQLNVEGGISYQWTLNGTPIPGATSASFQAKEQGIYSVTINDGVCEGPGLNTASLTLRPLPDGTIFPETGAVCKGQPILLTATEGYRYQWLLNNAEISGATSASYLVTQPGAYNVVLADDKCAADANNIAIISTAVTKKGKHEIVRVAANMPFSLQARNTGQHYLWNPATDLDNPAKNNPVVITSHDRVYTVTISSPSECPVTDTIEVQVFSKPAVYVPTAFTPDGNGLNDFLIPLPVHFKEISYFKVFNRWGEIVFQTNRIGYGWNGFYNGIAQPSDVYIWILEAKNTDGKLISEKGTCTLIR